RAGRPSTSSWRWKASCWERGAPVPPLPAPQEGLGATASRAPGNESTAREVGSRQSEGARMRVLITRPEREATALATALGQRGHVAVIAPLFRLDILHPPGDFAAALASCQAVLLTSANGVRALAEASEQRSSPIFAVGDTTA